MNGNQMVTSMQGAGLVTADAMAIAFNSHTMAKVLILGGLCGIITSWNSFLIGGSRVMFAMAKSRMIPSNFAKLHPVYKTPIVALLLLGFTSIIAPFFGRVMLVWIVDAANFACCLAYCIVSLSLSFCEKESRFEATISGKTCILGRYNGSAYVWLYGCDVFDTWFGLYSCMARDGYCGRLDSFGHLFGY